MVVRYNEFWKSYKNKTEIEKVAIASIKRAIDFLFDNIPRDKIVAVYIKGSFVTREMNKKSDVDIVPILRDNQTLRKFRALRDKQKETFRPSELLPISLTELKRNRNIEGRELKGRPDTFLTDLAHHKLIYGIALRRENYPTRNKKEMFLDKIRFVKNKAIPLHKEGKFGFQQLIKQAFWICYLVEEFNGRYPPRTWRGLNKFVKNKNHIIHRAYYFRMHPTKDKRKRKAFVKLFERYLDDLIEGF